MVESQSVLFDGALERIGEKRPRVGRTLTPNPSPPRGEGGQKPVSSNGRGITMSGVGRGRWRAGTMRDRRTGWGVDIQPIPGWGGASLRAVEQHDSLRG